LVNNWPTSIAQNIAIQNILLHIIYILYSNILIPIICKTNIFESLKDNKSIVQRFLRMLNYERYRYLEENINNTII